MAGTVNDRYHQNAWSSLSNLLIHQINSGIDARVHNPIPVNEFNDHVNYLREGDNKQCKLEYEVSLLGH